MVDAKVGVGVPVLIIVQVAVPGVVLVHVRAHVHAPVPHHVLEDAVDGTRLMWQSKKMEERE